MRLLYNRKLSKIGLGLFLITIVSLSFGLIFSSKAIDHAITTFQSAPDYQSTLFTNEETTINDSLSLISKLDFDLGIPRDIMLVDNYAFIASEGLLVFDVTDKSDIKLVTQILPGIVSYALDIQDDYLYLIDRNDVFYIINIQDPIDPQVISTTEFEWNFMPEDITVSGNYAYMCDRIQGLVIMDISNKLNPNFVTIFDEFMNGALKVSVDGNIAYVTGYTEGLVIVDITDKYNPIIYSEFDDVRIESVVIDGNFAYVSSPYSYIRVLNITDLYHPEIIYNTTYTGGNSLFLENNILFCSSYNLGYHILNVTDPTIPELVANATTPKYSYEILVSGNNMFLVSDSQFDIYSLIDLFNPQLIESYSFGGYCTNTVNQDNIAFINKGDFISFVNLENAENPIYIGDYYPFNHSSIPDYSRFVKYIKVSGNYLFIIIEWHDIIYCWQDIIHVVDITQITNPTFVCEYGQGSFCADLTFDDNYSYSLQLGRLNIYKLESNNATFIGNYTDYEFYPRSVLKYDNTVLLGSSKGLKAIDVQNKFNPTLIANIFEDSILEMEMYNGYLYTLIMDTSDQIYLQIWDIEDLYEPDLISEIQLSSNIHDFTISETHIFLRYYYYELTDSIYKIIVINQQDIENLEIQFTATDLGLTYIFDLDIINSNLVVTAGYQGLYIYELEEKQTIGFGFPLLIIMNICISTIVFLYLYRRKLSK